MRTYLPTSVCKRAVFLQLNFPGGGRSSPKSELWNSELSREPGSLSMVSGVSGIAMGVRFGKVSHGAAALTVIDTRTNRIADDALSSMTREAESYNLLAAMA